MCQLMTVGVLAERLGIAPHRVRYLIKSRGLEPKFRAGIARVYGKRELDLLRSEVVRLERIKEENASRTRPKPAERRDAQR